MTPTKLNRKQLVESIIEFFRVPPNQNNPEATRIDKTLDRRDMIEYMQGIEFEIQRRLSIDYSVSNEEKKKIHTVGDLADFEEYWFAFWEDDFSNNLYMENMF